MKKSILLFSILSLQIALCFAQNTGINTDGSTPEAGVMLDVKVPATNSKSTTAAVQTFFQIRSFDATNNALKLRLGFKTDAVQANRYGFIDFPDFTAGTPTYLNLCLQPSDGNVGIGTTTPRALLEFGGLLGTPTPLTTAIAAGGNESLILSNSSNRTVGTAIGLTNNGGSFDTYIQPRLMSNAGTAYNLLLNPLGGNVCIGTTTPFQNTVGPAKLTVQASAQDQGLVVMNNSVPQGVIQFFPGTATFHAFNNLVDLNDNVIVFGSVGGTVGSLDLVPVMAAGGITNGIKIYCPTTTTAFIGINTKAVTYALEVGGTTACTGNTWTSDIRKKKNIQTLELNGLDLISKLHPVTYEWKEVKDNGMKGTQMGFIAQELEKILPTMVTTANDSAQSKGVKYIEMLPILVKAIQEQQKIIDKQQSDIEAMKLENQKMKTSVEILLKQNNLAATK